MREWLKTLRIRKRFTQNYIADKIGVSLSYYNQIENGVRKKSLDLDLIQKIATVFNVSVKYIIEQENKSA